MPSNDRAHHLRTRGTGCGGSRYRDCVAWATAAALCVALLAGTAVSSAGAAESSPRATRIAQVRQEAPVRAEPRQPTVDPRALQQIQVRLTVVPELKGLTVAQAWEAVAKAELKRGEVKRFEGDTDRETVVRQSPGAGSRVKPGTPVNLYVQLPGGVVVPKVLGMPESRAWKTIGGAGLERGERVEKPSEAREGTVVWQEPGPGSRVDRGSPVSLAIAVPAGIEVPPLVGRREPDAWAAVKESRLSPGGARSEPADAPAGTVVRQDPAAGAMVEPGTRVRIWLAEPQLARVPELIGMSEAAAWAAVEKAELARGQVGELEANARPGTVVRQDPPPGESVRPGSPVRIWLAARRSIEVPDLRGMTEARAVRVLRELKLPLETMGRVSADAPPDTVVRQRPKAGTPVEPGTAVGVWLAEAEPVPASQVRVPPVTGMSQAEAWRKIRAAELARGSVKSVPAEVPAGRVIEQAPEAGRRVKPGSPVALVVSSGPRDEAPDWQAPLQQIPDGDGPAGRADSGPAGWPWGKLAGAAALGILLGSIGRGLRRRSFRRASVRMRPVKDLGTAGFEGGPPALAGPLLELRPRVDPGTQRVSPEEFFDTRGFDHD